MNAIAAGISEDARGEAGGLVIRTDFTPLFLRSLGRGAIGEPILKT